MMYRLCERYFNGAISTIQFEQQSARDQRLIISVLAIEQLIGAVRAPRAGISSRSSFERGKDLLKSQELLNEAIVEKNTAEKAFNALTEKSAPLLAQIATLTTEIDTASLDVAKEDAAIPALKTAADASAAALKKKDDQYKAAKVISDKPNATPEQKTLTAKLLGEKTPLTAKSTADATALKGANTRKTAAEAKVTETTQKRTEVQNTTNEGVTALSDAKKQFEDAQANIATAQSIRDAADSSANSSSGTVSFEPNSNSGSTLNKDTVTVLANAVTKIVDSTFDDDELARACLAFISRAASDEMLSPTAASSNSFQLQNINREGSFERYCAEYLEKQATRKSELKRLKLVAEINSGKAGMSEELLSNILRSGF